ncbi:unnamed protein product, partial [Brenthis ino]
MAKPFNQTRPVAKYDNPNFIHDRYHEYDVVETKFCAAYVISSRSGCPSVCPNIPYPICAVSSIKNRAVIFKNYCFLEKANCQGLLEEYEAVDMKICGALILSK